MIISHSLVVFYAHESVNIPTVNTLRTKCTISADLTKVTLLLNTLLSGVPLSLAFWSLIVVLHRHESCYESWKVGFGKKLEFLVLGSILARLFLLKWSKSHNENLRRECNREFSDRDSNKKHVKRFMQNPKRRETVFFPACEILLYEYPQHPLSQFYDLICFLNIKTGNEVPMCASWSTVLSIFSHTHSLQHFPGCWTLRGWGQSGVGRRTSSLHRGTQVTPPPEQWHWRAQEGWNTWPSW